VSDCNCKHPHERQPPRTWLLQLQTDGAGTSALVRLPPGRFWCVLGNEGGGHGYQVWMRWGGKDVQVDVVANGQHMATMLPCFPDAYVYLTNATPNLLYLMSVTE